MIRIKFKNRNDELQWFLMVRVIEEFTKIHFRYVECINDNDAGDVYVKVPEDEQMPCYHPKRGFVVGMTKDGKPKLKILDFKYLTVDHGSQPTNTGNQVS